jgi:GTP diphosphokinase / guanosine-3',5'-bis(diphosphate) 3'-diphosphatase
MKIEDLLYILPEHYTVLDRDLIQKAYQFAEKAHFGQTRASGEPYVIHCLAVAEILSELKVPPVMVVAGLLHDTVEDTSVTLEIIQNKFGQETASLVDGVTKLTHLPQVIRPDYPDGIKENIELAPIIDVKSRKRDLATETLRKTLMAMGDDVRVILIKLADRLHNMRTLNHMPEEKRLRIAQETMDIFAPLANRLGIWEIKWELEDLSFRYLDPEGYKEIAEKLSDKRINREQEIQTIIGELKTILREGGIKAEISGRPKHIFSIFQKMKKKNEVFEMVRDLRAIRLIVPDIPSCYSALGIIHTHWRPIPNEFDDYIASPKDNFYQSLHTSVIYSDHKPLEVQIRTYEMHENAEFGIAAHWRYKEKGPQNSQYEQRINWLRKIMEWRQDVDDAQEFVEGMKSDVFEDRVFVFTPRGDIIDMPAGSTPIDFAYSVHTEVGNRCRGAKVNGKLVSLDCLLKTGDQVEILAAKHGGPSRDWLNPHLNLVKTQRARSKIRQWFKIQNRELNISQGKVLLEKEFHRLGLNNIKFEDLKKSLGYKELDDFFESIGNGDLSLRRIINKLKEVEEPNSDPLLEIHTTAPEKKDANAIKVLGLKGILSIYAKCCNPVPGDEIVGYITRGRGATIHRKDCPNILRAKDRERIIRVSWGEPKQTFPVTIQVRAYDRHGLMGDVSSILANENINIRDLHVKVTESLANITIILDITDIAQLSRVLTLIETLPNVLEAFREKPG